MWLYTCVCVRIWTKTSYNENARNSKYPSPPVLEAALTGLLYCTQHQVQFLLFLRTELKSDSNSSKAATLCPELTIQATVPYIFG